MENQKPKWIQQISIDKKHKVFKDYNFGNEKTETEIFNLNRINIFVGANNSGKSRFLREVFKGLKIQEFKGATSNDVSINFPIIRLDVALELFSVFNKIEYDINGKQVDEINGYRSTLKMVKSYETQVKNSRNWINNSTNYSENWLSFNAYNKIIGDFKSSLTNIVASKFIMSIQEALVKGEEALKNQYFSTYIPVMRGLKKLTNETEYKRNKRVAEETYIRADENKYMKRVYYDYFKDMGVPVEYRYGEGLEIYEKIDVFTGEGLYQTVHIKRNSIREEREKINEFEKFIKRNFFKEGFDLLATEYLPNNEGNENKDLFVAIGNEKERPIYELGDGIQALIILTFPLFLNKDKNHLLFIDEPELNLHPGMQRLFLETLLQPEFENTQVFISTHSNHFLNVATEISSESIDDEDKKINPVSIFSFKKQKEDKKFLVEDISKRGVLALDLLGVNNSSVFLSNCIIWVEGISERLYIRKYLELYYKEKGKEEFKEDFHFSFIEYAGSNLTHWAFSQKLDKKGEPLIKEEEDSRIKWKYINKNAFVIADTDENKETKHQELKDGLKENYHQLVCREIENLLTPDVIRKTLSSRYMKEGATLNKVADSEYDIDKPIGDFMAKLIKGLEKDRKKNPFQKDTEKLENKKEFTQSAINQIEKWSDLSKNAKDFTERIYEFITKNNQL